MTKKINIYNSKLKKKLKLQKSYKKLKNEKK